MVSAILMPRLAFADNCNSSSFEDVSRNAGLSIASGAIQAAVIGGAVAATAALAIPALAGAAFAIFAGVTAYGISKHAIKPAIEGSIGALEKQVGGF